MDSIGFCVLNPIYNPNAFHGTNSMSPLNFLLPPTTNTYVLHDVCRYKNMFKYIISETCISGRKKNDFSSIQRSSK
jgi:hypothetical protein